jgi:hypothetical protein
MNDNIQRAQVTINAMKLMIDALEDVGQRLPTNPKLYAFLSESPIEELRRMSNELDVLLEPLKHVNAGIESPAPILDNTISPPTARGPIESTS